jgi:segregation and condensation protein A
MTENIIDSQTENYRVDLEVFSGPLDLLLYLIKVEEVDIYAIPIARITRQYLRYIELMKTLDLEVAGEFVLMAATLIRIKTRLLLPRDETDTEEPDPREELIMALVEYKKFKEGGEILRQRAFLEEQICVPPSPAGEIKGRIEFTPATGLYDLLVAFREITTARFSEQVHEVDPEDVSVEDRILIITQILNNREMATFGELFADMPRRRVAVVTFAAMLEMARESRIRLFQAVPFSEIRVYRDKALNAAPSDLVQLEYATSENPG